MNKKISLIEDDPAILDIYQTMIQKAGFDVEVFPLGKEFLQAMEEMHTKENKKPDLVLLDLILPDMSGEEILVKLKKNPLTQHIKVFILSNKENASGIIHDINPDKYIIKADTSPTALIKIIQDELN